MSNWNPKEKPFRVRKIRSSGAYGSHGWADRVTTYATLAEAVDDVNKKMTSGEYSAELDLAKLDDNGRHVAWVRLANRKINKPRSMTNDRKNITQPSDWWAAFEEAAAKEGLTLSAWIGEACKSKLPVKVAKKLTARPPANRPKKVTE